MGADRVAFLSILVLRAFAAYLGALSMAAAAPFPAGSAETTLEVDGVALEVYSYKPPAYDRGPILLVLHGLDRNAPGYRDHAKPLADRYGYLVVAPLFDRERFPTWRYQQGGIARVVGGEIQPKPPSEWTGPVFEALIEAVRREEGAPDLPFLAIGHSAGGQALGRYAAFLPGKAQRMIVANPSSYVWPSRETRYPYGYGGLPASLSDDAALRRYLAQPMIVMLGTADVKQGGSLNMRPGAMAQGPNRYERGHNFFRAGEQLARERGWTFGWRLVEVPGVGHSARRMFGSEAAAAAFAD